MEASCICVTYSFVRSNILILYDYILRVDLLSVSVGITSCLDSSGHDDLQTLTEILLCELSTASKCNASDEVCTLVSVAIAAKSSVHRKGISCHRCRIISL